MDSLLLPRYIHRRYPSDLIRVDSSVTVEAGQAHMTIRAFRLCRSLSTNPDSPGKTNILA